MKLSKTQVAVLKSIEGYAGKITAISYDQRTLAVLVERKLVEIVRHEESGYDVVRITDGGLDALLLA